MSSPEIISPIGRIEHLNAALEGGADAAYVGLCGFSARPDSASFSPEDAAEVRSLLHAAQKRMYLAVNAQMFQGQMETIGKLVEAIHTVDPDALILSDLGLAARLRQNGISIPFHASNLLGVYNLETVRYLRSKGFKRVILVSNLFFDEIASLTSLFPEMEYEIIARGGLCANDCRRCRLPHEEMQGHLLTGCQQLYWRTISAKQNKKLIRMDAQPARWLGVGDMDLSAELPLYLALGFRGFKIEGRTRDAQYVLSATRTLRQALDAALSQNPPDNALPYLLPGPARRG